MMKLLIIQIISMMSLSLLNLLINILPSQNKFIHPMIMSMILLMLLLFSSLSIELYMNINWISYLMYLIIIGGLMIIFLYFTSFISNMKMTIKLNYLIMIPIKLLLMFIFFYLIFKLMKFNYPWYSLSNEINKINNLIYLKINTMYMYMYNKNYTMIFCMIYLLLILMFIVKICINKKLSLRKIN